MNLILKRDICYSVDRNTIETLSDGYLVCKDDKTVGVFKEIPMIIKGLSNPKKISICVTSNN